MLPIPLQDILGSCLYCSGLCIAMSGKLAPVCLAIVGVILYNFRYVGADLSPRPLCFMARSCEKEMDPDARLCFVSLLLIPTAPPPPPLTHPLAWVSTPRVLSDSSTAR